MVFIGISAGVRRTNSTGMATKSLNTMLPQAVPPDPRFLKLRSGRGSVQMIMGILILAFASLIQSIERDVLPLLNGDALYHIISMPALLYMYLGGHHLQTVAR